MDCWSYSDPQPPADLTVQQSGSWGVRELVSVLGATSRTFTPSSTLEGGVFFPSEALYALATSNVNLPVDFNNAVAPSASSSRPDSNRAQTEPLPSRNNPARTRR